MTVTQSFTSEQSWSVPDGVTAVKLHVHGQDGKSASTGSYYADNVKKTGTAGSGGLGVGYLTSSYLSYTGSDSLYLKPGTGPSGGQGNYAYEDEYNHDGTDYHVESNSGAGGNASVVHLNGANGSMVLAVGGGGGASAVAGGTIYEDSDDPFPDVGDLSGDGGLTSAMDGYSAYGPDVQSSEDAAGGAGAGASTAVGEDGKKGEDKYDGPDTEFLGAVASGGGGGGWSSGDGGAAGEYNFSDGPDNGNAGGSGGGRGAVGIASNASGTLGGSTASNGKVTIEYPERLPAPTITTPPEVDFQGSIELSWSDVGASGYRVYRSTSSGSQTPSDYTDVGGVGEGTTTFTDSNISEDTTYYYRLGTIPQDANLEESIGGETSVTTEPAVGFNLRDSDTSGSLLTTNDGSIITE